MSFLKFLKREKKKEGLEELDLPPAPPPLEGFDEDMSMPEFPDIRGKQSEEMPEFNFPEEDFQRMNKEAAKNFPDFPRQEKPVLMPSISATSYVQPQFAEEMPEAEENQQAPIEQPDMPPREKIALSHGKKPVRVPMGNSLYLKVDRFKIALGSINVVRNDLRKSEEALMKMENIKSMEEKSMSKIRSSLDDLQKKLVFVDKTLFEGE